MIVTYMWWKSIGRHEYKNYWLSVHGESFALLSVRGCGHALVAMAETAGHISSTTYELELVATGLSVLRDGVGGKIMAYSTHANLLDCSRSKTFWLAWNGGRISVGEGAVVGELMFLQWTPINYHGVNGIALASSDDMAAEWEVLPLRGVHLLSYYYLNWLTYFNKLLIICNNLLYLLLNICDYNLNWLLII